MVWVGDKLSVSLVPRFEGMSGTVNVARGFEERSSVGASGLHIGGRVSVCAAGRFVDVRMMRCVRCPPTGGLVTLTRRLETSSGWRIDTSSVM